MAKRFFSQDKTVYDRDYLDTDIKVLCIARSRHAAEFIQYAMNDRALRKMLGRKKKKLDNEKAKGELKDG